MIRVRTLVNIAVIPRCPASPDTGAVHVFHHLGTAMKVMKNEISQYLRTLVMRTQR